MIGGVEVEGPDMGLMVGFRWVRGPEGLKGPDMVEVEVDKRGERRDMSKARWLCGGT